MRKRGLSKVLITDTTLRDAHQSLLATRLRTEDMLPLAAAIDQVGFFSVEAWGGATFDAAIRFLNEDPWERLRALKKDQNEGSVAGECAGDGCVHAGYPAQAGILNERVTKNEL